MGERVGVQFVEVGHAHRQVGIGEQLDRLGLGRLGEQHRHVGLERALLQQPREGLRARRTFADDDPGRVQVVVQRPAFAQEFRREDDVVGPELRAHLGDVADRNGGFDHHGRLRIDLQHLGDHDLDRPGVEIVGVRIVVSGCGDDHELRAGKRLVGVQGGLEVQATLGQRGLEFLVDDRRAAFVEQLDLGLDDVQRHHFMVPGEQHAIGQTDIAGTRDSDLHWNSLRHWMGEDVARCMQAMA